MQKGKRTLIQKTIINTKKSDFEKMWMFNGEAIKSSVEHYIVKLLLNYLKGCNFYTFYVFLSLLHWMWPIIRDAVLFCFLYWARCFLFPWNCLLFLDFFLTGFLHNSHLVCTAVLSLDVLYWLTIMAVSSIRRPISIWTGVFYGRPVWT